MCSLLCTAVLSPLSPSTALLTILQPVLPPEFSQVTKHPVSTKTPADSLAGLPDVVSRVLGVVFDMMEEDGEERTVVLWIFFNHARVLST